MTAGEALRWPDGGPGVRAHQTDPAGPVAAEWGGVAVPPAWVLARVAAAGDLSDAQADRIVWAMLVRAERDRAGFAAALDAVTHEFRAPPPDPDISAESASCVSGRLGGGVGCYHARDHAVHQTPAVVQARLDAEATPPNAEINTREEDATDHGRRR
jgi:hypothetical protein